jgi:hypothetical protein
MTKEESFKFVLIKIKMKLKSYGSERGWAIVTSDMYTIKLVSLKFFKNKK